MTSRKGAGNLPSGATLSRRTVVLGLALSPLLGTSAMATVPDIIEAARSLAPTGRLRVAINLGNSVLAQRRPEGELTGITVLLARKLAGRLKLPLDLIAYDAAGKVFEALDKSEWDLAFLAIEPERATKIDFSPPYVFIDSTYLVRADTPFSHVSDLDRRGVRITVSKGAAYDLYLTRALKRAELIRAPTGAAAVETFVREGLDAVAGVRQFLDDRARAIPGLRVLSDSFQRVDQAIGVPKGRPAAVAYVYAFIEEMKRSGEVRRDLDATGQRSAGVAPPA